MSIFLVTDEVPLLKSRLEASECAQKVNSKGHFCFNCFFLGSLKGCFMAFCPVLYCIRKKANKFRAKVNEKEGPAITLRRLLVA